MALCAGGSAPNITALPLRESVALVSGQCGVPQWPGTTKLSRGVGQQRGHVPSPVAALGGNGTSPLNPVRCSVVSVSGHGGVPPCPGTTKLSRGLRGSCGTRPLRPPASLLHNAAFCEVVASRYAKAALCVVHRFRALTGSQNRPYAKWPSLGTVAQPSALPGRVRALRAASRAPFWLSWRCGISQALRALFWSVACGQSSCVCPCPPSCFAAARHQPCALVCPSAPRGGSLSPRAFVFGVCYKFSSWSRTEYGGYRPNGL